MPHTKRILGLTALLAVEPIKVRSKIDTEGALPGNLILQVLESHGG